MEPPMIQLYDTTLRDGLQMAGIALSQRDKFTLVQMLHNQLNITNIEIYPFSNPKDRDLIASITQKSPDLLDSPSDLRAMLKIVRKMTQILSPSPKMALRKP